MEKVSKEERKKVEKIIKEKERMSFYNSIENGFKTGIAWGLIVFLVGVGLVGMIQNIHELTGMFYFSMSSLLILFLIMRYEL